MTSKQPDDNASSILRDLKTKSLLIQSPEDSSTQRVPKLKMGDFLKYDGVKFVEQVFRRILLRDVDENGATLYHSALETGRFSKEEVLCFVRYSQEGEDQGISVEGMPSRWQYRAMKLFKTPLGRVASSLYYCLRLPSLIGKLQALEYQNTLVQHKLAEHQTQVTDLKHDTRDLSLIARGSAETPTHYFSDKYYDKFERTFRGEQEDLLERFRVYLYYVDLVGKEKVKNCLDIGSGHGVWLDMLRDHGQNPEGVDLNLDMVNQCKERGHQVTAESMVDYLQKKSDASLDVITGFHIIEHISTDDLARTLEESFRCLDTGGLVLFESPNPENLRTSAYMFYLDPTHSVPVHPLFMQFLLKEIGFVDIEILKIHPADQFPEIQDPVVAGLIRGPQDYAIMGRKP